MGGLVGGWVGASPPHVASEAILPQSVQSVHSLCKVCTAFTKHRTLQKSWQVDASVHTCSSALICFIQRSTRKFQIYTASLQLRHRPLLSHQCCADSKESENSILEPTTYEYIYEYIQVQVSQTCPTICQHKGVMT